MTEKELEIKAALAANIFTALTKDGTSVLDYITGRTIDTTNKIFKGIQT